MRKNKTILMLCEGGLMLALAQLLGYLKFYQMPYGGSVTLAMVPLIFFAARWGWVRGLSLSFAFGILQLLLDGAYAYTWQAMLLDYFVAFTPIGLAGLFRGHKAGIFWGAVLGIFIRFLAHTFSGIFVWAEYMPSEFLGMPMTSPWLYSPIYNGIYMGLNLVLTLVVLGLLYLPLKKYMLGKDLQN